MLHRQNTGRVERTGTQHCRTQGDCPKNSDLRYFKASDPNLHADSAKTETPDSENRRASFEHGYQEMTKLSLNAAGGCIFFVYLFYKAVTDFNLSFYLIGLDSIFFQNIIVYNL